MSRILKLREVIKSKDLQAFLIPNNDEYNNEYLPPASRRLEFITGFTGSAGTAVIGLEKAAFFTDGRYTLQAAAEIDPSIFEIYNYSDKRPAEWIREQSIRTGYDPMVTSASEAKKFTGLYVPIENLVDTIWHDRPNPPATKAFALSPEFTGQSWQEKASRIAASLDADITVLTSPDSVNWLLNIRGNDIENTPFCLSYAALTKEGKLHWFVDNAKLTDSVKKHLLGVEIHEQSLEKLKGVCQGKLVALDPARTPFGIYRLFENIVDRTDPCLLPKAVKNGVEIAAIRKAHELDGKALSRFLKWLFVQNDIDELKAAEKLEHFRKQSPEYKQPSFTSISGFGSNGAIVHYRSTPKTNKKFEEGGLYLIDSGGQYEGNGACGTTDVTRTIAIGEPSAEMKRNYTLVLKGHVALATAIFPRGTSGAQLDSLARQFLWKEGKDYDHGTGHGVGCYLSVHEGPQGISRRYSDVPLAPGMILSNEPGYYKTGEYGIRIENLVLVVEKGQFLGFETLTKAPFDENLIEWELLTPQEADWVKAYQSAVG